MDLINVKEFEKLDYVWVYKFCDRGERLSIKRLYDVIFG